MIVITGLRYPYKELSIINKMSLANFSIIVAMDSKTGIAKNGAMPWNCPSDMQFFSKTTKGSGKNIVIMGRLTYETLPEDFRPLPNRLNIVISRTYRIDQHPEVRIARSFVEALKIAGTRQKKACDDVFVIGGEQIYNEAVRDYLYLCDRIFVTRFKTEYDCDQFFPWDEVCDMPTFQNPQKAQEYTRFFIKPNVTHPEYQYLETMRMIKDYGEAKPDRTGVGTISKFGVSMEYDISERLPVFTTKLVSRKNIIHELLFFVSGKTNTKDLEDQKVNIWKGNTSREFLDSLGLTEYDEGEAGPIYGFQWRNWGAEYDPEKTDYRGEGIDQLQNVIDGIRNNPASRRHILSAWNVSDLDKMALPPCHMFAQFNVSGDKKYLDCQLYQRSGDFFLGVPYNVTSYALLTRMIAHVTQTRARKLIHVIGDAHIYSNHVDAVEKQLQRTPLPFPTLKFRSATKIKEIDDFDYDSFIIDDYESWPKISAPMAV